VFWILSGCVWLFNIVPRQLAVYVGGWLGLAVWTLSVKDQHKSARHLTLALGDTLSHSDRRRIGRNFFINSGKNMADVLRFKKHFASEILPLIDHEGMEHFATAAAKGKGVFGVTGHIGNFEMVGAYVQSQGFDIAVIGRELYDPRLTRMMLENREAVGMTNISTTDSPKRIIKWLRDGNLVGVLIDTDSHRVRGQFIPAFGRWSNTPVGQTILALKTGAALVPAACLRTPGGRYQVVVKPEVLIDPSGDFDTDVYNATLKCTQALEEIVREHLEQWPWQHNRWRTRREATA
jgi:KDO2-lipid IV(A) lauroyltransferase